MALVIPYNVEVCGPDQACKKRNERCARSIKDTQTKTMAALKEATRRWQAKPGASAAKEDGRAFVWSKFFGCCVPSKDANHSSS